MNNNINLKLVTQSYRTLGLSLSATLDDCRRARNEMVQKFAFNDRPSPWRKDFHLRLEREHLVQESYLYILEHYEAIRSYVGSRAC